MQKDILLTNLGYRDINPLVCGEHVCPPNHSYGPHIRHYYLLHYVLSGQGCFRNTRGEYTVRGGELFVIRPGESTTYTADADKPWHYRWVGFECSLDIQSILKCDVIRVLGCDTLFQALMESSAIEAGREMLVCGKIHEILALIANSSGASGNSPADYARKALNYIHANYMQALSVTKLSGYLNIDRSYFCKVFRKVTGKPPQKYIVDYRLQKAAELLSVYGKSPGAAAQQTGYGDIFNFSRMFKKKYGVAPSKYSGQASPSAAESDQ